MKQQYLKNLYNYMAAASGDEWYELFRTLRDAYKQSMSYDVEIWPIDKQILKLLKSLEEVAKDNLMG